VGESPLIDDGYGVISVDANIIIAKRDLAVSAVPYKVANVYFASTAADI
jgi:hypothetical protein